MRPSNCLCSSRRAFHRIFSGPAEARELAFASERIALQHTKPKAPSTLGVSVVSGTRSYHQRPVPHAPRPGAGPRTPRQYPRPGARQPGGQNQKSEASFFDKDLGYDRRNTTQKSFEASGKSRLPRDFEITDPRVMLLRDGTVEGPFYTQRLMEKLDSEQSLRMIQPFMPPGSKRPDGSIMQDGSTYRSRGRSKAAQTDDMDGERADSPDKVRSPELSICQVVDKKEQFRLDQEWEQKQKKAAAAARGNRPKEVELTWAIDDHDLEIKLGQVARFLDSGAQVVILLGNRRKGQKKKAAPTKEEAEEMLVKIKERVEEGAGAKQSKPPNGQVGGVLRLFFEKKEKA